MGDDDVSLNGLFQKNLLAGAAPQSRDLPLMADQPIHHTPFLPRNSDQSVSSPNECVACSSAKGRLGPARGRPDEDDSFRGLLLGMLVSSYFRSFYFYSLM